MRLILGEDEVLLRAGLARLLADEGYDVVATASNAPDLVSAARSLKPDLVITDIRMPPTHTRDGIEAALRLREELPSLAVLVLSQYVDSAGATELLGRGARASATCSSSGSWTSTRSCGRSATCSTAAPRSTPPSWRA